LRSPKDGMFGPHRCQHVAKTGDDSSGLLAGALRASLNLESSVPAYRQIANDPRRHLVERRERRARALQGGRCSPVLQTRVL
jgi:hypothetical protein